MFHIAFLAQKCQRFILKPILSIFHVDPFSPGTENAVLDGIGENITALFKGGPVHGVTVLLQEPGDSADVSVADISLVRLDESTETKQGEVTHFCNVSHRKHLKYAVS